MRMGNEVYNKNCRGITTLAATVAALICVGVQLPAYSQSGSKRPEVYDWLQFNFDAQHSGNDTKETELGQENISGLRELYHVSLPDVADGAPVYLSNVYIAHRTINMIFVTTKEGDIVALDASTGEKIWQHQYGSGSYRINNGYQPTYTTSSPVVDFNKEFVYSYGLDGFVHKYHVESGDEVKSGGWPELTTLKPFNEKGSSPITMATAKNGVTYLYMPNGGYLGDRGDYQGHVTAINLTDGSQHVFNANCSDNPVHFVQKPGKPDCTSVQSAIWARAGVVYLAATDRIYMATGNGPFNPAHHDWGDTIFSLNPDGTGIDGNPVDSYTPSNEAQLNDADLDLGSTAPAVIPVPDNCAVKNLVVQGGKDAKLRLVNLEDLSGKGGPGHTGGEIGKLVDIAGDEMLFTAPAVWTNPKDHSAWVFVETYNNLAAYRLNVDRKGMPSLKLMWKSSSGGSSPVVANDILYCAGSNNLRAIDPVSGKVLWHDSHIGRIHWESPIVDNGGLFITDESGDLHAYGLK